MTKRSFLPLIMALATFFCLASCDKEDPANPGNNNTQSSEIDYFADFEVSTSIKKRCAVIEEYTGTKCGACPDGHERVRKIMEKYPGKVFSITIHQGPFAPQYATQWGDAFASQAGVNSYPAGTISRTVYEDGIQQDRTKWDTRCANIKNQRTIVNLAARVVIDTNTRHAQIMVKGYYTDDADTNSHLLNIAVLQNDVLGPQSNYGNWNAEMYTEDGQYRHMHMLRDLITGQWGEPVNETTKNSSFTRTYEYTIPEAISNEPMVIRNLEFLVFINRSHYDIITATQAEIIYK